MAFFVSVRIRRGKKKKSSSGDSEKRNPSRPGSGLSPGKGPNHWLSQHRDSSEGGNREGAWTEENDWVYVIVAESRREGFIPHSYWRPANNDLKKKLPRSRSPTDLAHRDVSQLSVSDGVTNDGHSELGSEAKLVHSARTLQADMWCCTPSLRETE
ncbi:unnamed protein product [Arctia plantaginis]|uniref:Uncharacterized protein n=1 Tax=Arctia plantaginis TaxID=874455 RepID=A0A8S1BTF6_ARCPL|nr:unnamed protein product [Arctia plantaginis]